MPHSADKSELKTTMAVEAVASVVIQKLTDMLTEESIMSYQVIVDHLQEIKHALKEIKHALKEMEGYFIDAEDNRRNDKYVQQWTDKYISNLYYVEDVIESFALRFTLQSRRLGFLMNYATLLNKFTAFRKLSHKMKKSQMIMQQLNRENPREVKDASVKSWKSKIKLTDTNALSFSLGSISEDGVDDHHIQEDEEDEEDGKHKALHPSSNTEFPLRSISENSLLRDRYNQSKLMYSYSCHEALEIVGLQKDVDHLVKILTNPTPKTKRIVSIVGDMGSGKTTLAWLIYRNRNIKECFPSCCAWATVSKDSNKLELLLKLLNQVTNSKERDFLIQEETLMSRLFERLKDKKYLIILDGLRSPHLWNCIKDAIPDNRNGSRIIITCMEEVGEYPITWPHRLRKLSYTDAWDLFLKKAGLERGPAHLRKILLQACNRSPLNIVLLGSLLSVKKPKSDEDIASSLREWGLVQFNHQSKWETIEIVSLSYNDLSVSSKLCLLYMVLFPKEFDVPVRRLLRLWQAEGFVKQPDDPKVFPEDVAQEYFDDLVKRSLIQVSKLRSDGSAKKCRLLGVVYDYLFPRALDISLFHIHNIHNKTINCRRFKGPLGVRRLVEYTDIRKCPLNPSEFGKLRSYLSFNSQRKDIPAKEVGNILTSILDKGLRLLRVLDLEGVYKPSLPKNIGDLLHLRYLGLRWTFLESLPKSIGNLHYLETLDVKHTYINTLPTFIWKLKRLRHLNLNGIRIDMPSQVCDSLPQLLTLWGLFVDDESLIKGGLSRLEHLRELGILFCLSNSEELLDWVSQLTALQSLRLRSKDDLGCPSKLSLKPLTKLTQLSHLNLMGSLEKLPDMNDFPQGIKKLTLSVSKLTHDPMPILEQLPSLSVLRLLANSYHGKTMKCSKGGFRVLRGLKLWWMPNLEEWVVEDGAMDGLKELNIRCCNKLRTIPPILVRQKTFKELILTNMPEVYTQVEQIKSSHLIVTCKDYDFTQAPV